MKNPCFFGIMSGDENSDMRSLALLCDSIVDKLSGKMDNIRVILDEPDSSKEDEELEIRVFGISKRKKRASYEDVNYLTTGIKISAIYIRSRYIALVKQLLSILGNLDLAKKKNLEYCIDCLSHIIADDAHRALYFRICDTIPQQILNSPVFKSLSNKHKFDAYNILNIIKLAELGDFFLNFAYDIRAFFPHFLCNGVYDGEKEAYFDKNDAVRLDMFGNKARFLAERVIENYEKTEELINGLTETELTRYYPRIFLPVMDFVVFLVTGSIYERRTFFIYCRDIMDYIRDYWKRDDLPRIIHAEFRDAYSDYRSKLAITDRSGLIQMAFPIGFSELDAVIYDEDGLYHDYDDDIHGNSIYSENAYFDADADDNLEHDSSLDYSYDNEKVQKNKVRDNYKDEIKKCIMESELEAVVEDISEDENLINDEKVYLLSKVVEHLGISSINSRSKRNLKQILERSNATEKSGNEDNFLINYSETKWLQKIKSILSRISEYITNCNEISYYQHREYNAQMLLVACYTNDDEMLKSSLERFGLCEATADINDKCSSTLFVSVFYDGLVSLGYNDAASRMISILLEHQETESKMDMPEDRRYYFNSTSVFYARLQGDEQKIEYFKRKRDESLGLEFLV